MTSSLDSNRPSPMQRSMPGVQIPGIEILNEIGRGGMATVYLARQASLQRPVAIKILNNPDSPGFHERFMNEGRYIAALSHSNIVDVYDVGESGGYYYIVMEYLPGGDLKSKICKGIKPSTALKLVLRIASCLDYLHGQGIVHRDLKPANILFRSDSNPVITDFGIAKLLGDSHELTSHGALLGSPSYLSPEQATSEHIDGRSDFYSLGVMLYEMLTGERPFDGTSFAAIVMSHLDQPIPRLPAPNSGYQQVIDQLLAKKPEDRFQNGVELTQAIRGIKKAKVHPLRDYKENQTVESSSTGPWGEDESEPQPRGSWLKRPLPILALFVLAGLAAYSFQAGTQTAMTDKPEVINQTLLTPQKADEVVATISSPAVKVPSTTPVAKSVVKSKSRPIKPVKIKRSRVDQLFIQAYERMDALKLSVPKGDNALLFFQKILQLEPDNMAAKAGIRQIVRWYAQQAEKILTEGDVKRAGRYIQRGLSINTTHPKLLALKEKLEPTKSPQKTLTNPFKLLNL